VVLRSLIKEREDEKPSVSKDRTNFRESGGEEGLIKDIHKLHEKWWGYLVAHVLSIHIAPCAPTFHLSYI
jgi:hypothetical protein